MEVLKERIKFMLGRYPTEDELHDINLLKGTCKFDGTHNIPLLPEQEYLGEIATALHLEEVHNETILVEAKTAGIGYEAYCRLEVELYDSLLNK